MIMGKRRAAAERKMRRDSVYPDYEPPKDEGDAEGAKKETAKK